MAFNRQALLVLLGAHDGDSLQAGTWEELSWVQICTLAAGPAHPQGIAPQLWAPALGVPLGESATS